MTKLDEIRKNAEMAIKFQSWGNAAEACRDHIPWLLEKLDALRVDLEAVKLERDMEIISNTKTAYKGTAVMEMNNVLTEKLKIAEDALELLSTTDDAGHVSFYEKGPPRWADELADEALAKIRGEG